jgi:hypothetical protein
VERNARSPCEITAAVAGKLVDIYDFPDGRLEIRWKGLPLPYSVFDQLQCVSHAAIIENKRLGECWPGSSSSKTSSPTIAKAWPAPGGQTRKPA